MLVASMRKCDIRAKNLTVHSGRLGKLANAPPPCVQMSQLDEFLVALLRCAT